MKLISRRIVCSISKEEAQRYIRAAAYFPPSAVFAKDYFMVRCPIRRNMGRLLFIKLRGAITEEENGLNVELELHADFNFFLGCAMSSLGIVALLWYLSVDPTRWLPGVGLIVLGLIFKGCYLFEGKQCINNLEKQLIHYVNED